MVRFHDSDIYHASRPKDEWVHAFVHMLDDIPCQWCVSGDFHREITTWEELLTYFSNTLSFADADPIIHSALQHIYDVVLKVVLVTYLVDLYEAPVMKSIMEFYNVTGGLDDGDDPRNINILDIEGS